MLCKVLCKNDVLENKIMLCKIMLDKELLYDICICIFMFFLGSEI